MESTGVTLAVVIPVRAGSKGIPGKNLALVGGRPLLDWTVEAALGAARETGVVVLSCRPAEAEAARDPGGVDGPGELGDSGAAAPNGR